MRRRLNILAAMAFGLLAGTRPARAQNMVPPMPDPRGAGGGIVVDHPPAPFGGPGADLDFFLPSVGQFWQRNASDFTLTTPATIRRVIWWGFYEENNPPASEIMRLRFYEPRPSDGLPGNVLFEESFIDPQRIATGVTVFPGHPEFRFQVDLPNPTTVPAGTPLWFEVVQVDDISTLFRWEDSATDGLGHAFINPLTLDWVQTTFPNDLAFQLSTVPEPAVLGLIATGAIPFVCRRRKVVICI